MSGTAVVVQLLSLFFCCVSGGDLLYAGEFLTGSDATVTLTVGAADRVTCAQLTGPFPTSIEWYDPQGQLVSRNAGDEVRQAAGGAGRVAYLDFQSYQQSQGGMYECRVAVQGNNLEKLPVCIGPTSKSCDDAVTSTTTPTVTTTMSSTTTSSVKPSPTSSPTSEPPSKVMGVRVTPDVQNTSPTLTVVWQALAGGAVTYTIKYSTQPGEVNTPPEGALEVRGISGTSTILTALKRGTTYYIWVVGVSEGGEGPHSDRMSGVTFDNVPPPTDGSVSVVALNEAGKVRVTWSRPTQGLGQVITGYSVQYRRRGSTSYSTRSVSGSRTTSYTITNLNLGTVYEVRVASRGSLGLSGYCCGSGKQVTTYNNVPPPTDNSVSVATLNRPGRVRVTWSVPTLGPGQVITGYSVQYRRRGSASYTTRSVSGSSTTSYTITNLNLGTVYEVRVASRGPLGLSGYCCRSGKQVTTYNNVPRPTDGSVSVVSLNEAGKVRVTWSRPTLGPGQVITGYSVQYRRRGSASYTTRSVSGPRTTSYTITNLNLGTVYEVRVASVGRLGLSGYCCGSGKQVKTYNISGAPMVNITSGSSWLYLEWNAQSATFRVLYRESGAPDYQVIVPRPSQLSYNISALQPNTLYNIVVEATHTLTQQKVNSSVTSAYTVPAAPEGVSVQVMSAASIKVSWTPAPTASTVSVTYYINASSPTYQTVGSTVSDPDREVVLSGLHPFAEYYITVQAGNPGGLSEPAGRSAATLTAAPSAPPESVVVREKGAHWAMVGWGIPPEAGRNGIIISYIVQLLDTHGAVVRNETVAVQDPTFDSPQSTVYNLTSLRPYTIYLWRVAATTTAGTGPFTSAGASAQFRTLQWSPGPVSELSYNENTETSVNITWKPPKEPNGRLVSYIVEHGVYNKESLTSVEIDASRPRQTVFQDLEPGVPYNITVRASTVVGEGEPTSIVVFTVQQAPTAQVSNVKLERISSNRAAFVSWTPLTLHQARGFPVYFVAYQPSSHAGRLESLVKTVNTNDSKVVIGDLDPTIEYTFTVDVATAGGKLRGNLGAVEAEKVNPASTDSSSATAVGLFLGGVVAGTLVVLLIEGIVCGACRLRRSKHKSSPSGKAVGEDVPMEDNPAYGEANIYDTVQEQKETDSK